MFGGLNGEGLNASSPSLYPSAGGVTLIFLLGAYIHQMVTSVMSDDDSQFISLIISVIFIVFVTDCDMASASWHQVRAKHVSSLQTGFFRLQ